MLENLVVGKTINIMYALLVTRVDLTTMSGELVSYGVVFDTAVCPVCGGNADHAYFDDCSGVLTRSIVCEYHTTVQARVDCSEDLGKWLKLTVETGLADAYRKVILPEVQRRKLLAKSK